MCCHMLCAMQPGLCHSDHALEALTAVHQVKCCCFSSRPHAGMDLVCMFRARRARRAVWVLWYLLQFHHCMLWLAACVCLCLCAALAVLRRVPGWTVLLKTQSVSAWCHQSCWCQCRATPQMMTEMMMGLNSFQVGGLCLVQWVADGSVKSKTSTGCEVHQIGTALATMGMNWLNGPHAARTASSHAVHAH